MTTGVGARLLGSGREAEVFTHGDAVLKLYRSAHGHHRAEAAALSAIDGRAGAPRLLREIVVDGRPGLVMERLPGRDMLSWLQSHPWQLRSLARSLAEAHVRIHSTPAGPALPDFRELMDDRIRSADLPPRLRDSALRSLGGLPSGDRLCHGDFHPGNVLTDGEHVGVIDWPYAARGPAEADHARTLVLLRWADPPEGVRLAQRAVLNAGRRAFAREYSRAYWATVGGAPRSIRAWMACVIAARLAEGLTAERAHLLSQLERAAATAPAASSRGRTTDAGDARPS